MHAACRESLAEVPRPHARRVGSYTELAEGQRSTTSFVQFIPIDLDGLGSHPRASHLICVNLIRPPRFAGQRAQVLGETKEPWPRLLGETGYSWCENWWQDQWCV